MIDEYVARSSEFPLVKEIEINEPVNLNNPPFRYYGREYHDNFEVSNEGNPISLDSMLIPFLQDFFVLSFIAATYSSCIGKPESQQPDEFPERMRFSYSPHLDYRYNLEELDKAIVFEEQLLKLQVCIQHSKGEYNVFFAERDRFPRRTVSDFLQRTLGFVEHKFECDGDLTIPSVHAFWQHFHALVKFHLQLQREYS